MTHTVSREELDILKACISTLLTCQEEGNLKCVECLWDVGHSNRILDRILAGKGGG